MDLRDIRNNQELLRKSNINSLEVLDILLEGLDEENFDYKPINKPKRHKYVSDLIGALDNKRLHIPNTQYFREAGLHFQKHGYYQKAPIGTRDYIEYWTEQKRRCIDGYTVGDMWIPGEFYYYLNFCPILRQPTQEERNSGKYGKNVKKIFGLPDFWEMDLMWYLAKDEAWNRPYGEGNHIMALKNRGCGLSYKGGSSLTHNYTFIPRSKSFVFASKEDYITGKDGILLKAWDQLNHLDSNTNNYFKRLRQKIDQKEHKRASYIEDGIEKGFRSEISGIIVNDPSKVRGARGALGIIEEVGSMPNLIDLLEAMKPLFEEGDSCLGQIVAFGTGGEEEAKYLRDLEEVFYNPVKYNFAAFENKWQEEGGNDTIGLFIPSYISTPGFFDSVTGRPDVIACKEHWLNEFKKVEDNPRALLKKKAERPFTPSDIFLGMSNTIFPLKEIRKQRLRLQDPKFSGFIKHGRFDEGTNRFIPNLSNRYIHFPHRATDELDGEITIYETYQGSDEETGSLYYIVFDPYMLDDSDSSHSLGCSLVYKSKAAGDTYGDKIVAEYTARPKKGKDEYHKNLIKLAKLYNAKIHFEIMGGGQDFLAYCRNTNHLHFLEFQPDILSNKEINSGRNKKYGINLSADNQRTAMLNIADWIITPCALRENGDVVLNLHNIYSEGILAELEKYNDKGNFDRISCLKILMWVMKDRVNTLEQEVKDKSNFFNRRLFTDKPNRGNGELEEFFNW